MLHRIRAGILPVLAVAAVGGGALLPSAAPAASDKRKCVHYKTYKKGKKTYKRCSKYKTVR